MFFPDAAVVEWSNDDSSVLIPLRGKEFQRVKLKPPRPDILGLLIDQVYFQIIDLDSNVVTPKYASAEDLLAKHQQWEAEYWKRNLGLPVETHNVSVADCAGVSLWDVRWPEEVRAARQVKATSQVYLSFVAGRRIVVVSSAVMEGQSVADRYAYLGTVAREVRVQQGPVSQEELRRWLEEKGWKISPSESGPG